MEPPPAGTLVNHLEGWQLIAEQLAGSLAERSSTGWRSPAWLGAGIFNRRLDDSVRDDIQEDQFEYRSVWLAADRS